MDKHQSIFASLFYAFLFLFFLFDKKSILHVLYNKYGDKYYHKRKRSTVAKW